MKVCTRITFIAFVVILSTCLFHCVSDGEGVERVYHLSLVLEDAGEYYLLILHNEIEIVRTNISSNVTFQFIEGNYTVIIWSNEKTLEINNVTLNENKTLYVSLAPSSIIKGYIKDNLGNYLPNARVTIGLPWISLFFNYTTNETGFYEISTALNNNYTYEVSVYHKLCYPLNLTTRALHQINWVNITLNRTPWGNVTITVSTEDNATPHHLVGFLFGKDVLGRFHNYHIHLKNTNQITFTYVPYGNYTVRISDESSKYIDTSARLNVNRSEIILNLTFLLSGTVIGYVKTEENNTPIANAKITVYLDEEIVTSVSNQTGYYEILADISDGSFTMFIEATGYFSKTIIVNLSHGVKNWVNITLNTICLLEGYILSEKDHTPIENAIVSLDDSCTCFTNNSGYYSFETTYGLHRIRVYAEDYAPFETELYIDKTVYWMNISCRPYINVTLILVDNYTSDVVYNATVVFSSLSYGTYNFNTSNGTVRAYLPADEWTCAINSTGYLLKTIAISTLDFNEKILTVELVAILKITVPTDNSILYSDVVNVVGYTLPHTEILITVQSKNITAYSNEWGVFSEKVKISRGWNIISAYVSVDNTIYKYSVVVYCAIPLLKVTSPRNGETYLKGYAVAISGDMYDSFNESNVCLDIIIDGMKVYSLKNVNHFTYYWNTADVTIGTHQITLRLKDNITVIKKEITVYITESQSQIYSFTVKVPRFITGTVNNDNSFECVIKNLGNIEDTYLLDVTGENVTTWLSMSNVSIPPSGYKGVVIFFKSSKECYGRVILRVSSTAMNISNVKEVKVKIEYATPPQEYKVKPHATYLLVSLTICVLLLIILLIRYTIAKIESRGKRKRHDVSKAYDEDEHGFKHYEVRK